MTCSKRGNGKGANIGPFPGIAISHFETGEAQDVRESSRGWHAGSAPVNGGSKFESGQWDVANLVTGAGPHVVKY